MQSRTASIVLTLVLAQPLSAQTFRDAPRPSPMIGFGAAVVIDGGRIYVGQPGEFAMFPMPASERGAVHVFEPADSGWTAVASVSSDAVNVGDRFAQALAVRDDRMAVGAPSHGDGQGLVVIFERRNGTWTEAGRLSAADGSAGDEFGAAVALSGNTVLVGAPGQHEGRGGVYAFRPDGDGWTATRVAPDGLEENERFGTAIAADGDRMLVGAPGPLPISVLGAPPRPRGGAAWVYRREGETWTREARLASGASGVMSFGQAVSLLGTRAMIGAPISGGGAGLVIPFTRSGTGEWTEGHALNPGQNAQGSLFGFAVAQTASTVVVAAPAAGGSQGAVRVFTGGESGGGAWTDAQQLGVRTQGLLSFFGGAVAVAGNRLAVGAPGADFFEGVGVVFEASDDGTWTEVASLVNEVPGLDPVVGGEVDCTDGKAAVFNCSDVDLVAFMPVRSLGAGRGIMVNDVWGWTDSTTGREYALVGRTDATAFVDLSDPSHPVYLGELPLTEGANVNLWRDIKVYRNHAYIVADGAGAHGMQVFDLTQLRDVRDPPVTFAETAHYDDIFSAHNIVIDEASGFAYAVGSSSGGETCGGGLHMISLQDPERPTFAGCFADPATGRARTGYSHDAQCIVYHGPDQSYDGHEICFGSNETALSIADVTDKANPVAVSSAAYPNVGYAHQGWVSEDHKYFYMDDEGDELVAGIPRTRTMIWDIEDLDDPVLAAEYFGETRASDHNLYVRGHYVFESNYVAGLRILDISDPVKPVEVGYFDTMPFGENAPGFAGSWSNYPFFASGMILVTSMREGLFILKKRETVLVP